MKKNIDMIKVDELVLFMVNSGDLFESKLNPYIKALTKKDKKGLYDKEKAVKGYYNIVNAGLKTYCNNFYSKGTLWHTIANTAERKAIAEHLEANYYNEYVKED